MTPLLGRGIVRGANGANGAIEAARDKGDVDCTTTNSAVEVAARRNLAERCSPLPLTALELRFLGPLRSCPKRGS
jgi:hypothetical protein